MVVIDRFHCIKAVFPCIGISIIKIRRSWDRLIFIMGIDQFHKSQNAPVPYPTMLYSEQKCAHFCSEWSIVGYGAGAFWDLWIRSIPIHGKTTFHIEIIPGYKSYLAAVIVWIYILKIGTRGMRLVLFKQPGIDKSFWANGSTAFNTKFCCHGLKGKNLHHIALRRYRLSMKIYSSQCGRFLMMIRLW